MKLGENAHLDKPDEVKQLQSRRGHYKKQLTQSMPDNMCSVQDSLSCLLLALPDEPASTRYDFLFQYGSENGSR